jgi:molybdopterin-containing oxidoreductase family iron-sulfur binding subunit
MPEADTVKFPEARKARIKIGEKTVEVPVWILPGMADHTVLLTVGYGRTAAGHVGDGVGVDVYPVKPAGRRWARGVEVSATSNWYPISSTQSHWSLEGRTALVRAVDLPAWKAHGDEVGEAKHEIYKTAQPINFAERLGEMSHMPPNVSVYENPFNKSKADPAPDAVYAKGPQWGMTIDLSTCTGCGACTIACQAENNIPVVGKKEVQKGREMAWIRVDRYFTGEDFTNPDSMLHQPVPCQHCENAPCETVCPVNATVHGPEGINYMTYNRCIGTRYCANNCPYKVRRFNFFEYGKLKFNGDYYGKSLVEKVAPERGGVNGSNKYNKININLIPPRLRQKLEEIERMQKNPDVTVRMRGVMEKCSYCIQRINAAKIECKLNDLKGIPDGFFQSACQQACPSGAIVFGDILDPQSAVHATRNHGRSYMLLGYLDTRPRTSYLVQVRNPNPRLRKPVTDPFHHGGGHHGGEGEGHDEAAGKEAGHAFYEPRKRREDGGYAVSLRVLGSAPGVQA